MQPADPPISPSDQPTARRGVTLRAALVGTIVVLLVSLIQPYNDYALANSLLIGSYLPLATVLAVFVLVVLLNTPLHRFAPRRALTTPELAVILTMSLVGSSVPGQGLLRTFIPSLVAPFYVGQANGQFWNAFSQLGLPKWLFPVDSIATGGSSRVVQEFYGRTPGDMAMPLTPWIVPLLGWGVFLAGLATTFVSLAFLFRVQWGTNERLPFPLARLQLSLIESPERGRSLNRLFRAKGFWFAAGAVLIIHSLSTLHGYFPQQVPAVPLSFDFSPLLAESPWNFLPWDIKVSTVYFTFIGIAYFVQSRTAFSLWSIWVIVQFITMFVRMGGGDVRHEAWKDQHFAGGVVYLLGILWLARGYLAAVFRSFVSRDVAMREGRRAMIGIVVGIVVMIVWLCVVTAGHTLTPGTFLAGVPMAALIVGVILLAHITAARMVAETGMPSARTIPTVQQVIVNFPQHSLRGTDVFFALNASANGVGYNREGLLGFTQQALQIDEGAGVIPRETKKIIGLIVWSLLLAVGAGSFSSLHVYYSHVTPLGGKDAYFENKYGLTDQPDTTVVQPFASWAGKSLPPPPHSPAVHFAIGAGVTAALTLLSWRFPWWPFVPVGYIASAPYIVNAVWFSIMLGWLAKVLIVRFGGASLYQKTQAIFIGLIFGEALAAGLWLMINLALAMLGYDYRPVSFLPT